MLARPLLFLLLAAGCDAVGDGAGGPREGQRLAVTDHAPALLPPSREGYAAMAAFAGAGRVHLLRPGSGAGDPPRLVRSFDVPGLRIRSAQVDRAGYVWVATPDFAGGGPHRAAYVVDPHAGRVHRVVALPEELRAVADLVIGPERVYLYAWRNGFSGAVGSVDRRCAEDAGRCNAAMLVDLGNVGGTPVRAFHLADDALYAASNPNSRDRREAFNRINPASGQVVASAPYAGNWAADADAFYAVAYYEPGVPSLVRLDKGTLSKTGQVTTSADEMLIAHEGGLLYLGGYDRTRVVVRSAETLAPVREYDVAAAGLTSPTFGFVAPGVLMLNGTAALDVATGAVMVDPAAPQARRLFGISPYAVRLPEGHPLAY